MQANKAEYSLSAFSGVIAATLAANAVIAAWRNPPTLADGSVNVKHQKIRLINAYMAILPTATAQEIGVQARLISLFGSGPADFTGGTDLSNPAAPAYRLIGPDPGGRDRNPAATGPAVVLQSGNVRIATTVALTEPAGTSTKEAFPFKFNGANTSATPGDFTSASFAWLPSFEAIDMGKGLVLPPGTGFCIQNGPVAFGAATTARLWLEVLWSEQ